MVFKSVDGVGKSRQVFLFGVPSLGLTSCKSLLLLVQITFLGSEGEERREEERERRVMERRHTKTHCLHFYRETFSFSYYLSTRNCLFQFFCMFISEASVGYSHLIRAGVTRVIYKCAKVVI